MWRRTAWVLAGLTATVVCLWRATRWRPSTKGAHKLLAPLLRTMLCSHFLANALALSVCSKGTRYFPGVITAIEPGVGGGEVVRKGKKGASVTRPRVVFDTVAIRKE